MNLAAVTTLSASPEVGTWYRALDPRFSSTALSAAHSTLHLSRFSAGSPASPSFQVLYLAEDHLIALLEAQALLGSPVTPGGLVPHPRRARVVLNVQVRLQSVADLTDVTGAQQPLGTSAQELTGDWRAYAQRSAFTTITQPTGPAPTQELGAALFADGRFEGFRTLSAKLPYQQVLVVFPERLRPGSFVRYLRVTAAGEQEIELLTPGR